MDNKKSRLTILAEIAGILSLAVAITVGVNQWKLDETTTATDDIGDKLQPNQEKNKAEKIDTSAKRYQSGGTQYIEDKPTPYTTTSTSKPAATTGPKITTKGSTSPPSVGSGRWEVRAGTFQHMDNARDCLARVIRMGYTNAEIKKTKSGRIAVIVLRSNSHAKAEEVVDQLVRRGVDAHRVATEK